jgi:peptide/nickel transport system substrate-binding protein
MKKVWSVFALLLLLLSGCRRPQPAGNEVRVVLAQDPESLNPVNFTSKNAGQLINLLFQSLLTVDLADGKLKPLLAEALPFLEKNDTVSLLTYRIRPDAKWANGSAVTAADVAFSLKVLKAPLVNNEKLRPVYDFIRDLRIDPKDPNKFTLVCAPFVPEHQLLSGDFFILPQYLFDPGNLLAGFTLPQLTAEFEALAANTKLQQFAAKFNRAELGRDPKFLNGSAGYELASWQTGRIIQFKRKTDWWGKALSAENTQLTANPEKITFKIISDNAAALLAFKKKQLDVWSNIPAPVFKQLQAQKAISQEFQFFTPQTYSVIYFGLNGRDPKFSDKYTRQALAHLFDLKNIISLTQANLANPTIGPVSPENKTFYNNKIQPYSYNLKKAEELLLKAGWHKKEDGWHKKINGEAIFLSLQVNYAAGNSEYENIGLIFQQAASKLSIPVTLQPLEGGLLSQKLKAGDSESFIRSIVGNPFIFNFQPVFHTESIGPDGLNYTGFGNSHTDKLIEELYLAQSEETKKELLTKLQEALHDESNLVFLYFQRDRLAISKRFTDLKVSGIKPGYDVSAFQLTAD